VQPNKVTCYKPGTVTNTAGGYSYSDSAGTDGTNGFSGTNHGRYLVYAPEGTAAPAYTSLSAAQQRDILRFMNNLAMSNWGGVPTSTWILNHFAIQSAWGGYKKWYSVDSAFRSDYLIYWNAADNCAYIMTNLPGWQGAIANITTKYGSLLGPDGQAYDHGPLGLPTSNFMGDAWGNSWQRFTNGYITSRSTGYGDMTMRAYYVGGSAIEDKALAGRYSKFFDYTGSSGTNSYPLTQDAQCSNSMTINPSCTLGKTGRFTKALGPFGYVQTIIARRGQAIAYSVGGEIGNRWRAVYGTSQPWNGALGFPKSDEFAAQQNFDNGYIAWNGVATIYTPATCSDVCPTSPSVTTCWNTTTGSSTTCGAVTCSVACTWGSEPSDYCYDGTEGNANSTCGRYGLSRLDSKCLLDPTHAGCNPLNQSNYAQYGICNDGTTVAVVPDVATRPWTSLTNAPAANGEQQRINTLMNNAAALIGCTYDPDYWPISDVNVDPASQDLSTAAYFKQYANSPPVSAPNSSCGEVYFNRALGCAFPVAKTDTPVGTAKVATAGKIYDKWSTAKYTHGLPSSLPHRTFDGTLSWQRFKRTYFTYRYPDAESYYIGGAVYGTMGEGAALGARFGRDFDYYLSTTKVLSLNPTRIVHDTSCVNGDSSTLYGACGNTTTGLVGVSATSTYFIYKDSTSAYAMSGDVQTKYFALAGGVTPQAAIASPPVNPTGVSYGLAFPVGELRTGMYASSQQFIGGKIYSKFGASAAVANTMSAAYDAFGGPDGELGFPLEDTPTPFGHAVARTQRFEKGNMSLDASQLEPTIAPDPNPSAPLYLVASLGSTADGLPVRLSWFNRSGTATAAIYRKVMPDSKLPNPKPWDAGWTLMTSHINPPILPAIDGQDDIHATREAKNCYYIDVNNGAVTSEVSCVFVRGARTDDPRVVRLELRVKVADVSDAGTDDSVHAFLGMHNDMWIDSSSDDFERGSDHSYFIMPLGLNKLTDISGIRIEVDGDDAVCINEIELYVNRPAAAPLSCSTANGCVFRKTYGNTNSTCHWVENSEDYVSGRALIIGSTDLRNSVEWNADLSSLGDFTGYNESGVLQAIEAIAGHYMHGKPYNLKTNYPPTLYRLPNSLGEMDDTTLGIHVLVRAHSFLDVDAMSVLFVNPYYSCWRPRDTQIVGTTAVVSKPQINETTLTTPVLHLLNLVWWPLVDPGIKLYYDLTKHDRVYNYELAPPEDHHFCFPTEGGYVNGIFTCQNWGNFNFAPEVRTPCKTVAARIQPAEGGYVDTLPASSDIQCGPSYPQISCVRPYNAPYIPQANQIYLHATALPGYTFSGWHVDFAGPPSWDPFPPCVSTAGTQGEFCYVNTADNPIVTATFSPNQP
jgi:hypothetical protein